MHWMSVSVTKSKTERVIHSRPRTLMDKGSILINHLVIHLVINWITRKLISPLIKI